MLLELYKIKVDGIDFDEAVVALSVLKTARTEYSTLKIPTPDWMVNQIDALQQEITARHRDYLKMALKQARQRADNLQSREEKRAAADKEIRELEDALGQGNV